MRVRLETSGGAVLFAGEHVQARFQQRVCPALDAAGAVANLQQLTRAIGEVVSERPAWLNAEREDASRFLMLGPDVALPLNGTNVVTCIVPGPSDLTLAERATVRRQRSETRRRRRGKGSQAGTGNGVYGRRGAGYRKANRGNEEARG